MQCHEVLFEALPLDTKTSIYDEFGADWIDKPLVPPRRPLCVHRKARRTQREILNEIRAGFETGRFETMHDIHGALCADFYAFVGAQDDVDRRWVRIYSDGSVMYENKHYVNPWDLLHRFETSRQSWMRRIYQNGHSLDWHLRKKIKE